MSRGLSSYELARIQEFPSNAKLPNVEKPPLPIIYTRKYQPHRKIPKSFDGRKIWKDYLIEPYKQKCGSCWVYAAVGVLNNRYNIYMKKKIYMSVEYMFLCNNISTFINPEVHKEAGKNLLTEIQEEKKFQCYGDFLISAFYYIFLIGLPDRECGGDLNPTQNIYLPFYTPNSSILYNQSCNSNFYSDKSLCAYSQIIHGQLYGRPMRLYSSFTPYDYDKSKLIETIKQDIMENGPVASTFDAYSDFWTFNAAKEVYVKSKEGVFVSGHAIMIIGWGRDDKNKEFWIIQNSWGKDWGDKGCCRFAMGQCNIENNALAVISDTERVLSYWNNIVFDYDTNRENQKLIDNLYRQYNKTTGNPDLYPVPDYSLMICQEAECKNGQNATSDDDYDDEYEYYFPGIDLQPYIRKNIPNYVVTGVWLSLIISATIVAALSILIKPRPRQILK